MKIVLIAFDQFTDIDVHLPWDLLNRVKRPDWTVRILADAPRVTSRTGLGLEVHGDLTEAREADAVIVTSGDRTRALSKDAAFLERLELDPSRQLIGSMCSGALILGAKGLLTGLTATTYPTAWKELEAFGAKAVQEPFVPHGRIATAAGCLAAQDMAGWIIETLTDRRTRELALKSVQPVGRGLTFEDAEAIRSLYAAN
ncbi:MAG TPA: DJ-1/PfpI family protein [Holophagaceae bacterium]|nr:DJ-1/PfpI family protein [Holophagaceae bacterium]